MRYEATLLSESYSGGRTPGTVELIRDHLCFLDEHEKVTGLPIDGIEIRPGGSGNRYVYFTHPLYPGICIYSDDKRIIQSQEFKNNPFLKKAASSIIRNRRALWFWLILTVVIVFGGIGSLIIFRGQIVEMIASSVSPEKEKEYAVHMKVSAIAGKKTVDDPAIQAQLMKIVNPLVNSVNDKRFKFEFTIVEDPVLNAFALPGGAVVINSGLIEKTNSSSELAGVLAHEVSHVTRRHHLRGIISNLSLWLFLQGMTGNTDGIMSTVSGAGLTLGSLKYSRDFEREADDSGFDLMVKSSYNPQGMIDFFGTMQKESGGAGRATEELSFLTTHPGTGERIEALKQKLKQSGLPSVINSGTDSTYQSFKASVKQYFNQ